MAKANRNQNADSIFASAFAVENPTPAREAPAIADGAVITVTRGELVPWPLNPRRRFDEDELQSLGTDMRARGQDDALIVRPLEGQPGFWQILGGERRWRSGDRKYGGEQQTEIPTYRVRVRYPKDDDEALDIAWLHNAFSVPLTFTEKAGFIQARIAVARASGEADSLRKIAKIVKLSPEQVRQMENLSKLPDWIREQFDEIGMNGNHAKALLLLSGNDDDQRALFRQIERAGVDEMTGNKAVARAQQMRKTAIAEAEAETAATQTSLDLGAVAALPDDAATSGASDNSTRSLELETNAPAQSHNQRGNADDAELENDNWQSPLRAQSAGSGGVGSSAPAGSGVGFATAPEAGATVNRGPRKAPPLPGRAVADELRAVGQFIASGAPIPARLDHEIDMAIAEIETAISQLKAARNARQGANE